MGFALLVTPPFILGCWSFLRLMDWSPQEACLYMFGEVAQRSGFMTVLIISNSGALCMFVCAYMQVGRAF